MSREQCKVILAAVNIKRKQLGKVSRVFQEQMLFMDYNIRQEFSSFSLVSICGSAERNKFVVDHRFQIAFNSMTLMERVLYYQRTVNYVCEGIKKQTLKQQEDWDKQSQQEIKATILVHQGFRSWEETKIRLKEFKLTFQERFTIDLRNYIMRDSKNSEKQAVVLEAIRKLEPENIRFAFINRIQHQRYFQLFKKRLERSHYYNVVKMAEITKINHSQLDHAVRDIFAQLPKSKQRNTVQSDIGGFLMNMGSAEVSPEAQNHSDDNESIEKFEQPPLLDRVNYRERAPSILQEILKQVQNQDLSVQLQDEVDNSEKQATKQMQKVNVMLHLNEILHDNQNQPGPVLSQRKRNHKDMLGTILPEFRLKELSQLSGYSSIYSNSACSMYIYRKVDKPSTFKMELTVNIPAKTLVQVITNISLYKTWNREVSEGNIKMMLTSNNTIIAYLKHRKFSQWYRDRDFLFIRHLFVAENKYYLVDKSIQNCNFIPFQSITRGCINHAVWRIQGIEGNSHSSLLLEIDIDHSGLLNDSHQEELTLRYLKGFEGLEGYFKKHEARKKLKPLLDLEWYVEPEGTEFLALDSFSSIKTSDFQDNERVEEINIEDSIRDNDEQIFYSVEDQSDESPIKSAFMIESDHSDKKSEHEIAEFENGDFAGSTSYKQQQEIIQLTSEGLAILPKSYLSKDHLQIPVQGAFFPLFKNMWENFILRDNWELLPGGGFKLIHKKKIQAQNNVFSFILKTLKKNLLSGKGVTGISLPVEVFNIDSNLQRNSFMYTYAPYFLEQAAKIENHLERMKFIFPFAISTVILYTDPQKPFNPILGETYQGIIAGCPIYAEQISHHPPITAVYMVGRGYKVYSCLQQKVNFHLNSADGNNDGWNTIQFDDGQKIHFQTPSAELSGLTYGMRRFNLIGKSHFIDPKNQFFCELRFDEEVGFFGTSKWKYIDQFQGNLLKVTENFISKFLNSHKKISPRTPQILQTYYKIEGRWPVETIVDGEKIFVTLDRLPYQLQDYPFPLNSNTNYREDLIYRKFDNIARSQIQKERMENIQRNDRKLRAKFHGTGH